MAKQVDLLSFSTIHPLLYLVSFIKTNNKMVIKRLCISELDERDSREELMVFLFLGANGIKLLNNFVTDIIMNRLISK